MAFPDDFSELTIIINCLDSDYEEIIDDHKERIEDLEDSTPIRQDNIFI